MSTWASSVVGSFRRQNVGCNILTCRPAVTKYSSIRILSIYLVYSASFQNTHSNCEFTDGNGSVNSKDECIVRDALSLDKLSKQTTRRKKIAFVTVLLFPVIRRCCSADVKKFVVYFTFATHKLTKTPQNFANFATLLVKFPTLAHINTFIFFKNTRDFGTSKRVSLHSVVRFFAINATLFTTSISTSEQTDKSFYKSDE